MLNDISLETAMGDRSDRLDYWYFTDDMNALDRPDIEGSIQCIFQKGDVLLFRHYLQNSFGIWGTYEVPYGDTILKRYMLLFDGVNFVADHRLIHI